jgi:hypothetical protein
VQRLLRATLSALWASHVRFVMFCRSMPDMGHHPATLSARRVQRPPEAHA